MTSKEIPVIELNHPGYPRIEFKFVSTTDNDKEKLIPKAKTGGSAGYDLVADIPNSLRLAPETRVSIPTGIAIHIINPLYCGMLISRSGLTLKHGIVVANGIGLIDSDYQGELKVILQNNSTKDYFIKPLERIAQLVILPVTIPNFILVDEFEPTDRGENGFGSTGEL